MARNMFSGTMQAQCRTCGGTVDHYGDTCGGCKEAAKETNVCYVCWGTGGMKGANSGLLCPICDGTGEHTEGRD